MAFSLNIPFFAFRLRFETGGIIIKPLMDNQVIRLNQNTIKIAKDYATLYQNKVLNKGQFSSILSEFNDGDFYKDTIEVDFAESKDKMTYPDFSLSFDCYYKEGENGFWGIIPSLSKEAFGSDFEGLQKALYDIVKLEFAQNKRLLDVRSIVSAIWFSESELKQSNMSLSIPSQKELQNIEKNKSSSLLSKVAKKLKIEKQIAFGRKNELEQINRAVKGKFNRNFLIVGPSGVGKTSIIWEFARSLKKRRLNFNIWETTASTLVKELTLESGWQENLSLLCKELAQTQDFLFIRNLLELFEVGQYVGNDVSIGEYLRSYLSRGEINIISECTEEERARIELKSPNYLPLFQIIRMEEPKDDLEKIIINKVEHIAEERNIKIEKEAIKETIRLNRRFTPYSGFPGKPIRFLESIIINNSGATENLEKITRKEVIQNFSNDSGLPLFLVDPQIPMDPVEVRKSFNEKLFDQELAVKGVVDALASVKTALSRTGKPIASFLFVGPTGVGKTELAKILSEFTFGRRNRMIRFDMSEYSDAFSVLRLTGINYSTDGLLTSAIRREPFCLLLFDEIEKAHPNFYDLLLQVLGEGRLTDSKGKVVNFCSTIIIMTSNIGASNILGSRINLNGGTSNIEVSDHFKTAVRKHFRPELFNRIDQIIAFNSLSENGIRQVVKREIDLLKQREGLKFRRIDFGLDEEVYEYLAKKGYNKKYGARYLQRTIREELIMPLSIQLNQSDYDDQLIVNTSIQNDKIHLSFDADPLGLELLLEELDKINFADHASELRRQIYRLQEGQFYIRIISLFEILEREKKKNEARFWKDKEKSLNYSYYLETKTEVEELSEEIEELENEISLVVMGLNDYDPSIIERLKEWKNKLFSLKIQIYLRLFPDAKICTFALYGTNLGPIFNFYKELFERKGFEFTYKSIWYREQLYKEEIKVSEEIIDEKGNLSTIENKKQRAEYVEKKEKAESVEKFKNPKSADQLYGIEFELIGDAPVLYLQSEKGIHKWEFGKEEESIYMIALGDKKYERPINIHRKDFFRDNPMRIVKQGSIKDNRLKIKREFEKGKLIDFILENLDQQFRINLDTELNS